MKAALLRQFIALPLLLAGLALLHACGNAASQNNAGNDNNSGNTAAAPAAKDLVLGQGQSIAVAPGSSLRLDRVNDSRCRTGVVCVWAGYISYSFTLTDAAGSSSFVLADNMPNGVKTQTLNGLTFSLLGVEPQAVPAKGAPAPDYRVSLRVTRN